MTSQENPRPTQPVEYKGEPLDAARGPGLGCFWAQMILLLVLLIVTPLSATNWGWPTWVTSILFIAMILLLLVSGQTMIFLLRLVAAGKSEGRRRPLASATPTVGQIEDETPRDAAPDQDDTPREAAPGTDEHETPDDAAPDGPAPREPDPPTTPGNDAPVVRQ